MNINCFRCGLKLFLCWKLTPIFWGSRHYRITHKLRDIKYRIEFREKKRVHEQVCEDGAQRACAFLRPRRYSFCVYGGKQTQQARVQQISVRCLGWSTDGGWSCTAASSIHRSMINVNDVYTPTRMSREKWNVSGPFLKCKHLLIRQNYFKYNSTHKFKPKQIRCSDFYFPIV